MNRVALLDDDTINKIAAGEVVDRPASVIKELVENSLDAGANRIEVEIMAGGTSFMRVTDNGQGMNREDANLAVKRHATSKIRHADDLPSICTLGFRGEALPTIASVSRFTLITRPKNDELATKMEIVGGSASKCEEFGAGAGTTVRVEDLFFNTPARKKFLKTNHTEGGRISDFVTKLALSRPDVSFRFINNKKPVMSTPGNGNLLDTVGSIYGKQAAEAMLELNFSDVEPVMNDTLKIYGYVSKPTMLKSSRAWQTILVNGRVVQSSALARAIDNAYKAMIPKSGFPMAIIAISLNPHDVDVNVHPQKIEVRFADESRVFHGVYRAVLDALRPAAQTDEIAGELKNIAADALTEIKKPDSFALAIDEEPNHTADVQSLATPPLSLSETRDVLSHEREEPAEKGTVETPPGLIPIGQVSNCYIVAKDSEGMYIVDQHAAHERILYDKLSRQASKIPSQPLLVHLVLPMSREEIELIEQNNPLFAELGFGLTAAGEAELRLTEIPLDIPLGQAEDTVREIMTNLRQMHNVSAGEIRHEILAITACRAAIKAGDELSLPQMRAVLNELAATDKPYTCPHGRPTILRFTTDELDKMFKRTGF